VTALLIDGPDSAHTSVILAHGAGAAMDTPFMAAMADGLAEAGVRVVRFEFPFMAARRQGRKPPPDRLPVLQACFRAVVAEVRDRFTPARLVIGGKSMGGRVAALVADETGVAGVMALGYPFHPSGKPGRAEGRTGVVERLQTPMLICQGERDGFGNRGFVDALPLSPSVRLHWIPDGDHSLVPRKASGLSAAETWRTAVSAMVAFVERLPNHA